MGPFLRNEILQIILGSDMVPVKLFERSNYYQIDRLENTSVFIGGYINSIFDGVRGFLLEETLSRIIQISFNIL